MADTDDHERFADDVDAEFRDDRPSGASTVPGERKWLGAIRARMDLIASYPIHVNAAYLDRPRRKAAASDPAYPDSELE